MASADTPMPPGQARSPGKTYQQLLDEDSHQVPAVLRIESPKFLGDGDIPVDRYISREWHDREVEHLWRKVWQFACRAEEIPNVGDYVVYEIARDSYVIINTNDGIKAYPNACLHRGRRLKDYDGHCSQIRCPFHGFSWTLEGELADVPARWDFPHVKSEEFSLPGCKVGDWAGNIFINPDPDAEPLEDFLGDLPSHFETWRYEQRYKQAHVAKVIQANWKIAQEAFCEAYHVSGTHPQVMAHLGDTQTQVDIFENFSRAITPGGTPSPLLPWDATAEDSLRAGLDIRVDEDLPAALKPDLPARQSSAAMSRSRWRKTIGEDWAGPMSDAEYMDSIDYTIFPNAHPWGAFNRIFYRFRPNGDDHRSSIMECIFLSPFVGDRPPPAPVHWLSEDESFTDAPELGMLGKVFNQDLFNMPNVQLGLETTRKPGITLGNYQESKIRWLHSLLDQWVSDK